MELTRNQVLERLYSITFENPKGTTKHNEANLMIGLMLKSRDIPSDVLTYLDDGKDYQNEFMDKMRNKRFYRNINEEFVSGDNIKLIKFLSSYLTHTIIEIEQGHSLKEVKESLNTELVVNSLLEFINNGELSSSTVDKLKLLIS